MLFNVVYLIQVLFTAWFSVHLSLTSFSSNVRSISGTLNTVALEWAPSLSLPAADLVIMADKMAKGKSGQYLLSAEPFWWSGLRLSSRKVSSKTKSE